MATLLVANPRNARQAADMSFLETIKNEWCVVRGAPFSFCAVIVAVGAAVYVAVDWSYRPQEKQIQLLQFELESAREQIDDLKDQLKIAGVPSVPPQSKIVPTSPSYVVTLSNDNLRMAAYSLANRVEDYAKPLIIQMHEIELDDQSSPEERAKTLIELTAMVDEEFRAKLALDVANLIEEICQRTGGKYDFDYLNERQLDPVTVFILAGDLRSLARKLP